MAQAQRLFGARPGDFPVHVMEHVRWGDLDAFGHVNNTVFFQLFESARMEFMRCTGFMNLKNECNIGPIVAHTECYFRRPLGYPCDLLVATRTADVADHKFGMEYGIFERGDETPLTACGTSLVVCYDYDQRSKTQIPESLRDQLLELQSVNNEH